MITLRRAGERGSFDHRWLKTAHTFSFGEYHDPAHMGFRSLRVINDDVVAPGRGFAEHPHRDMEIITYPLSGTVRHRDSLGHEEDVGPGMIQRMSAGTGIRHSERNPSASDPVHLLQVWILPDAPGHEPRHETRPVRVHDEPGMLHLLASPDGREGSSAIHQDALMFGATIREGDVISHRIATGRGVWVHVARGSCTVNGESMAAGDGAAIEDEPAVEIRADAEAELLVFDLA